MTQAVRIGIDVGGTFTHAVAIDAVSLSLLSKAKVPTSHSAKEGVARGIIDVLNLLLKEGNIAASDVSFIAHSTTQATNALLEGDVAEVGILGLGKGHNAWFAKKSTEIKSIELAKDKFLKTYYEFLDSTSLSEEKLKSAFERLVAKGAKAIAISEAFSVDEPGNEELALSVARGMGLVATAGSELSKLYGLRVRTRTAVINAAMLPKMLETANMTEASVRSAGIKAPIMIMRSDGGVMDIDAMRKRPILTRLSGPAAGVAAAMMYLRISDGIFLEVGGTSTDISVIRNGKALVKDAEIGGHRVYLRSLDVNTLGVAGGSMIRMDGARVRQVGPRSAHIAGLAYVAFAKSLASPRIDLISPKPGDPCDYVLVEAGSENKALTLTPTCAANLLNYVPEQDCARGDKELIKKAFEALATKVNSQAEKLAEEVLNSAYETCLPAIKKFMVDYKLDPDSLVLVGGGGGAAAIVPYIAKRMGLEHTLAQEADVISAIGVALALLRETVERQIVQPKQDDLIRIREEAFNAVAKMGADISSIEVQVEVDPRANILRATAYGAAGLSKEIGSTTVLSNEEIKKLVSSSFKNGRGEVELLAETGHYKVYGCRTIDRKLFGLLPSAELSLRIIDSKGVIRIKTKNGAFKIGTASELEKNIAELADENSSYGDAGKVIPDFMILSGSKIIDLSGLLDTWQVQALARSELANVSQESQAVIIAALP